MGPGAEPANAFPVAAVDAIVATRAPSGASTLSPTFKPVADAIVDHSHQLGIARCVFVLGHCRKQRDI